MENPSISSQTQSTAPQKTTFGVSNIHWYIYLIGFSASIANVFQGYDGGVLGVVAAQDEYTTYFSLSPAMLGFSNSILPVGNILSNFFLVPPLIERFGRRVGFMASACIIIVGVILQASAVNKAPLLIGRFLMGVGSACSTCNLPAYQCEVAPKEIRGAIVSSTQTAYQVGALIAFAVGFGTSTIKGNWSWRSASLTMISLALSLIVIAYFLPESPRWLLQRYPDDKARAIAGLARVRRLPVDDPLVLEEFRELVLALEYQQRHEPASYMAFFKNKAMHKRVAFGCGTMFISQLCGSSALLFYGIIQFRSLGFEGGTWGMKLNLISGSIQLVACAVAFLVVDRAGRRPVFLCGLGIMVVSYVITASLADAYPNAINKGANIVSVICIYVIQSAYSGGLGPLAWIYASEIFPTHYRDKGINISQASQQIAILILNQVWPVMFANLSHNAYWILAGFNTIGFLLVFFLWPETKRVSLEQMDAMFGNVNRVEAALEEDRTTGDGVGEKGLEGVVGEKTMSASGSGNGSAATGRDEKVVGFERTSVQQVE